MLLLITPKLEVQMRGLFDVTTYNIAAVFVSVIPNKFHFANFTEDSDVAGLTVKYEDVGECADLTTYELTFLDQTVAVTRATANRIAYAFTQCVDVTFTLVRYLGGLEIGNRSVTQDFAPKDFNFINFMESSNDTGYSFSFDESCLCKDRATYTLTINDETIDVNYGQTGHHAKTFTACIPVVTFTLRRYVGGVEYGNEGTITDFAPQNFKFRDFKESSDNTGYTYYFDDDGLCTSLTNYKLSINSDTFDVTRAQDGSRSHTFTQCEENVKFTLRRYVSTRLIGDPIELTDFAPRSNS
ncbi:uncharacterized protein LOC108676720 [Hyalella azteca]|uniref:Uncharacterized protein LOC108676720 n=1 Tax=Hyalella azteca TaxID=294128 RepID=A0A8B7P2S8_HYAAZ|nr:uncharacterized protein LOC108676720 [Hyalella azteca]